MSLTPKQRIDGIQHNHNFSVVVYPGDRYQWVQGDWRGVHSDGVDPCEFMSGHSTGEESRTIAERYREADHREDVSC